MALSGPQWHSVALSGTHQQRGRARREKPGHVLDCERVHAHRLELACEIDVVLQIVLGLRRVGYISGVRDRTLDEGARRERRVDTKLEIVEIVE